MRDEEFSPPFHGFLDDFERGIHREHHLGHRSGGVAGHQAHLVPVLRQGFRPQFLDGQEQLTQRGSLRGAGRGRPAGGSVAVGILRAGNVGVHRFHSLSFTP
jgi:hypothetical protein